MTPSSSPAGGPYGLRDIRSLYPKITEKHLRYLEKWGLIRQGGGTAADRVYSFADLLTLKHVAGELERGTPLRVVLRTLVAERHGQLALDFRSPHAAGDAPRPKVVALQPRKPSRRSGAGMPLHAGAARDTGLQGYDADDPQSALAARYFLEASRFDDGDPKKVGHAAATYRKALLLDPDLVPAIVNLANIHYASDELIEAQALYERAVGLDPECFEAHFNLGNIHHDLGRYDQALVCYRGAVALNPAYPDAHFYLAVTLEKTGHSVEAKPHWKLYQDLAPDGEWVELAKEFSTD
jgi:tetratricopeptide (TPR) repeat protein